MKIKIKKMLLPSEMESVFSGNFTKASNNSEVEPQVSLGLKSLKWSDTPKTFKKKNKFTVIETGRDGAWDVMAPWLSRLLLTEGSWVRLPL